MYNLPELGVGITFFSGIEPILESNLDLIDVLEIEPQTLWLNDRSKESPYKIDKDIVLGLNSIKCHKLLHGIGFPVGGSIPPEIAQYPPLKQMISIFNPPWMSEHLSFNTAKNGNTQFKTGFLLPPCQTIDGVKMAVRSIQSMIEKIQIPFAVETGVNYLHPYEDEIPDGEFISKIVKTANCGILLDLHNIWANELNGRQTVNEFLSQIPLDRVWEIHLAGGFEYEEYWIDAHSGSIPDPLLEIARSIIPNLPNLKAINFELFSSFLPYVGLDLVRDQLKIVNKLWRLKGTNQLKNRLNLRENTNRKKEKLSLSLPSPQEWETSLGLLAIGHDVQTPFSQKLKEDKGIQILNKLVNEFRGSMVVNTMKMTTRLLNLTLGVEKFKLIMKQFWKEYPPQLFSSAEGENFANFIQKQKYDILYLNDVVEFEKAVLKTLIDDQNRLVPFSYDPLVILRALSKRELPKNPSQNNFEVEITAEDIDPKLKQNKYLLKSSDWHH